MDGIVGWPGECPRGGGGFVDLSGAKNAPRYADGGFVDHTPMVFGAKASERTVISRPVVLSGAEGIGNGSKTVFTIEEWTEEQIAEFQRWWNAYVAIAGRRR